MSDPILAAAGGVTILLGAALARALHADRRRTHLRRKLREIALPPPSVGERISLRRPAPPSRVLPLSLLNRLELAVAAAGGRLGALHLAAVGIASGLVTGGLAFAAELRVSIAILLGTAAAAAGPIMLLRAAQNRYQRRFLAAFPDALDLIVRAVRAGLPAPEAIELVAREIQPPVGAEFQRLLDELRIGSGLEEALPRVADRVQVPDFHFFVVSLLLQRRTGGGIAEILANLSAIIRQRKALRQKAQALAAEAQASAAVVAISPFIAGGGLFLINRDLVAVLFTDPRGRFMLGLAVAGLLAGIVTMKALIRRNLC